jgi:hypothetical protein
MIGMEWPPFWYGEDGTASALPLSLYCAILLTYWAALLPRPAPVRTRQPPMIDVGPAGELVGPDGEVLLRNPRVPEPF